MTAGLIVALAVLALINGVAYLRFRRDERRALGRRLGTIRRGRGG